MNQSANSAPDDNDLASTYYINHDHSEIVSLAKQIIGSGDTKTDIDKSILIHNYVRDSILFGWNRNFWNETAADVSQSRRGFCNTKSSLFAALLRSVGIRCRLQFVDINTQILRGLTDPRIPYELHTFTNVFVKDLNRWCQVDSYIVDKNLADNAKKKLVDEDRVIGYGVHRDGQSEWNGCDNCFIQYVQGSQKNERLEQPLSKHDYGHFHDIGHFYQNTAEHHVENRLDSIVFRWFFPFLVYSGNRATEALRKA